MGDEYQEPSENPFAKALKAPRAAPPEPAAASAPVEASPERPNRALAVSVREAEQPQGDVEIAAASPAPGSSGSTTADTDADADAAAKDWASATRKPTTAETMVPRRKGCCYATGKCCGAVHHMVASSFICTCAYVLVALVACFGFFVYSLVLLKGHPMAGNCPSAASCSTGLVTQQCLVFGLPGQSCENVCDHAADAGIAPVRFTTADFVGASGIDAYVYCPFPKMNTNWRIPLTCFSSVIAFVALLGRWKRWRTTLLTTGFLLLLAGGFYFYVMIIDSAAVDKAAQACKARYSSQTTMFGQAELQCSLGPYIAVCLLDAALSLFLMYGGAVLYSSSRLLAVAEKEEAAKAAARPKSEQITAQQKRAMFSKGDDDESSSSARPSFQ